MFKLDRSLFNADIIHVDTQTEKARFNKFSILGFISLIVLFFFWLPITTVYFVDAIDPLYDFMLNNIPFKLSFAVLGICPIFSFVFSIIGLVESKRNKQRGRGLSAITLVLLFLFIVASALSWVKAMNDMDYETSYFG